VQPDLVSVAVYQNDLKTTLALILCVYCNAKLGKYHQVRPAKLKKSLFFLWNKGKITIMIMILWLFCLLGLYCAWLASDGMAIRLCQIYPYWQHGIASSFHLLLYNTNVIFGYIL
jgi:hypothetical protein